MFDSITTTLSDSFIDEYRCYLCNGYLSNGPIRVLPNGHCICGRCTPVDKDTQVYRVFALEAVLSKAIFPCSNKKVGCKASIHFNRTSEHESKCIFYPVACPFKDSCCTWQGSGVELYNHLLEYHTDVLKENAEFNIFVNDDSQEILSMEKENFYIIRYEYNAVHKSLWYDVRYCKFEPYYEVSYRIQLLNANHPEYEYRCYLCNGYLSNGPIRVLPNGHCICGRCTPVDKDTQVYRVFALEAVLSKAIFPCSNKKVGCKASIHFNRTSEHESKCIFYPVACPFKDSCCTWQGSGVELYNHLLEYHTDVLKENAEFNIFVNDDSQEILSMEKENFYIIRYEYNAVHKSLWYDVRYCKFEPYYEVSYRIQLLNANHPECMLFLKTTKCSLYNHQFFSNKSKMLLNISQYYQCLDNPKNIKVIVHLKVSRPMNVFCNSIFTTRALSTNFTNVLNSTWRQLYDKGLEIYHAFLKPYMKQITEVFKTILFLVVTQMLLSLIFGKVTRNRRRIKAS
ncbi:hypothetical protein FQR65_LT13188 [Abscondita terminalis]|nr:hypothetical protein FQR65_LT13188 [Abscondita terminalis]